MKRLVMLLVLVGCGGPQANIPKSLLIRLPRDARTAVYDHENDVVIAKSHRDEAVDMMHRLAAERSQLSDRQKRMETRLKKMGADANRISLARKTLDAKREYLDAALKAADGQVDASNAEIASARARLELTKKQQLLRYGLASEQQLQPFEAAVKNAETHGRSADRRALDLKTTALKEFEKWKQNEEKYASATGDFDAGVWID